MTPLSAKPKPEITYWNGQRIVEKRAKSGLSRQLLENELQSMQRLSGLNAPRVLNVERQQDMLIVRRELIIGSPLSQVSVDLWPTLLKQLADIITLVHAKGLIHGDLKPANLIVNGSTITPVDWEHALEIGQPVADLPFRAVSIGTSDPRLIWGKGTVSEAFDLYSIARMSDTTTPAC
ncbi:RIO1 family regulatory kinase/ATPase [uncultured Sulfitobacter sp.]|uniref:RIO1 family regulatory kinase/ATPase domain-containing protein n=1 Tax=uncultured Sulfitobacter sp. TaxID=191468 RepID=UPI0030D97E05